MDDIKAIISVAQNAGISVLIISFFLYKDIKFSRDLQTALTTLINTVDTLKEIVTVRNIRATEEKKKDDN